MNTLQEIINNRAKEKAEQSVRDIFKNFRSNDHFFQCLEGIQISIGIRVIDFKHGVVHEGSTLQDEMVKRLTLKYIPLESQKFMDEVNRCRGVLQDVEKDVEKLKLKLKQK